MNRTRMMGWRAQIAAAVMIAVALSAGDAFARGSGAVPGPTRDDETRGGTLATEEATDESAGTDEIPGVEVEGVEEQPSPGEESDESAPEAGPSQPETPDTPEAEPADESGAYGDGGHAEADGGRGEGGADASGEIDMPAVSADAAITRKADRNRGPVTNMPLPRYVSLKGSEGNARRGPSLSHRIDWVFRHAGMPLRVVAEFGHWRRVEDQDGAGGWVHYSLLSGVRTVLIEKDMADLHSRPDESADVVARAEAGAIVKLGACTRNWCRVTGGGERGWVRKTEIWGVDPAEIRD